MSLKILQEPLLSAVGWFLGPNPNHIYRQKFTEDAQEIVTKIVAEKHKEMQWCQEEEPLKDK